MMLWKSVVDFLHIEWKRRGIIAGIIIGVYLGYRYVFPAALPFLLAWILAGWLEPISARVEKKTKIKKTITGTVLLAALFGLAGLLLYKGIAELIAQSRVACSNYQTFQLWLGKLVEKVCEAAEKVTGNDAEVIRTYLTEWIGDLWNKVVSDFIPNILSIVFGGAKKILFLLSGTVVIFISVILILGDMENIRKKIWDYSWLVGTRRVIRRLQKTTITYLKAQIIIIVIISAVCSVSFWFMRSPYYLLLGIAIGILDAVPLIGTGTFLYPAAVVFLVRGQAGIAAGCVLLDIVTSFLREFLEPRLLGEKLGVPPIVVLVSVYLGMLLYGVSGVILGPLAFSTVYEIGKEWDIWD